MFLYHHWLIINIHDTLLFNTHIHPPTHSPPDLHHRKLTTQHQSRYHHPTHRHRNRQLQQPDLRHTHHQLRQSHARQRLQHTRQYLPAHTAMAYINNYLPSEGLNFSANCSSESNQVQIKCAVIAYSNSSNNILYLTYVVSDQTDFMVGSFPIRFYGIKQCSRSTVLR